MQLFQYVLVFSVVIIHNSNAQQDIDPAYLRQYYAQIASQTGGSPADATPIYEQNPEPKQQYVQPGQQIRLKDNVQAQIRQQQQAQSYVAPSLREYLQHEPQVQYVPQQQAYRPQPSPQPKQQYRPRPSEYQQGGKLNKLAQEDPEDYDPNPSYQFGFNVKDDEFTNYQNREESRDGNVIKGSYSVVDSDGFIRTVKYTADPKEGFKAEVIREPTDIVVKVPTPPPQQLLKSGPHHQHQHQQQHQQQHYKQQQQQPQYQQYHE